MKLDQRDQGPLKMDHHEATFRFRQELGTDFCRLSDPFSSKTTQKGLSGIIESNCLWATNLRYLNDTSESTYGLSIATECFSRLYDGASDSLLRRFLLNCGDFISLSDIAPDREFYACCFCEQSDLLSQWRGYADRGTGYCIGLDTDRLRTIAVRQNVALFPVDYGAGSSVERLKEDLKNICFSLLKCIKQWPQEEELFFVAATVHIRMALALRAFWLKHPAFSEEKEWRLLANLNPDDLTGIRFRQGERTLIPFTEITPQPDKLPIVEVMHGPTGHAELAAQSIGWLVKRSGFGNVRVSGSVIPLRG